MLVITRIGWLSVGLVFGAMYIVIGLVAGVVFFLLSLVSPEHDAIDGIVALILSPVLYGVLGFVGGILVAALYNLVAPQVGGIRIETQPTDHI